MLARSSCAAEDGYDAAMSPSGDLFPELPDGDDGVPTLNVRDVSERIEDLLGRAFPEPFWLIGEASGLARARGGRAGHWYFKLVETEPEDPAKRASLDVTVWRGTVSKLFGPRGRLRGEFQPEDGAVLKVLARPNWYAPQGKLSFTIDDIDPAFTLGDLERRRRELLQRLSAEGALERNARLELPEAPLELGLVTSVSSAAYADVTEQLLRSAFGFRLTVCDARTQGQQTSASVVAALATLQRRPLDAILLVRGGGSRLDLAGFDEEPIARAIAACRLPVLTGIGHEIDRSVADEVAHTAFKTPTAVAASLVERAEAVRTDIEEGFRRAGELVLTRLTRRLDQVGHDAGALGRAARARLAEERLALGRVSGRFSELAAQQLTRAGEHLHGARRRLVSGPAVEALGRHAAQLDEARRRITSRAQHAVQREEERLIEREQHLRLLDPAEVLKRGYAYLRRADGSVLMNAADAREGEPLAGVLRDGELPLEVRPP